MVIEIQEKESRAFAQVLCMDDTQANLIVDAFFEAAYPVIEHRRISFATSTGRAGNTVHVWTKQHRLGAHCSFPVLT
jgi:hypothetical protein